MKTKKFFSIIFATLMAISPFAFSCANVYAEDDPVSDEFTVILKPGEGSGQNITVKSTDPGAMAPVGSDEIKKGQFGILNNRLVYRLPDMPEGFSAPENNSDGIFIGWVPIDQGGAFPPGSYWYSGGSDTTSISFNAMWSDSHYKLETPNLVDINGSDVTSITSQLTDLKLGTFYDSNQNETTAQLLYFNYFNGVLKSGNKSIPYVARSTYEPPSPVNPDPPVVTGGSSAITQPFTSSGESVKMEIYISPEDYKNASSGTYMGNLKYTGKYAYRWYPAPAPTGQSSISPLLEETDGQTGYIPLRLVIPESTYAVTLPENNAGFDISYDGSTTVNAGENFAFSVNIAKGYKKGENFAVRSNGVRLEEADGKYIIPDIQENQFVTIEGVESIGDMPAFFKTGDTVPIIPLIVVAAVSLLGFVIAIILEKKPRGNKYSK